ncbi:MAG: DUF2971 domain-containing protein [Acidobacteriota bacterium]|nr:DUF2971 domain-containing protein [Acidobacteriota bacterium]
MATRKRKPKTVPTVGFEADVFNQTLSSTAQGLLIGIQSWRGRAQSKNYPGLLYHYTNAAGLLGIVEHNKIWATHINFLNDASELIYARRLVEEALKHEEEQAKSAIAREFFRRAATCFDVSQTMDVFVSCFCEEGDLLSQWRGYAQAGEGYSIGVDGNQFGLIGGGRNFFFGPVEYDREAQERIVGVVLTMVLDGLNGMTKALTVKQASPAIDECCKVFRRAIWYPLVTFKDVMFAAENEWRATEIMTKEESANKVRFRSSGSKLVPYIELDFSQFESPGKIPIRQICHGPTLNPQLSVRVLQLLLSRNDYHDAEVRGSRIPLRV